MDYFLNKYRVPSARAVWHRYEAGTYFVTICTKGKVHYFGRVVNGEMEHTALGRAAVACWEAVPRHFPHVEVVCFVVMPNHVHAVIRVNDTDDAACEPRPDTDEAVPSLVDDPTARWRSGPQRRNLSSVVRGFKVGVTAEARRRGIPFGWQTRFHDHIIRNQREYDTITRYVVNNPALWHQDRFRQPEP